MSWDEFLRLTLAQLEALKERRDVEHRYARFNSALIAAILINKSRSPDSEEEPVSPFDFISGYETTEKDKVQEAKRKAAKQVLKTVLANVEAKGGGREMVATRTRELNAGFNKDGLDGEEIVREVFPELRY